MSIKINTEISEKHKEIEVIIYANSLTKEVQSIVELIQNLDNGIKKLIGTQNNDIFIINLEDIITIYSEGKSNYCRTNKGKYKIKQTLYDLEKQLLAEQFVRISNSCIINLRQVECFNTSIVGSIGVKLKDDTIEYVSRRRVSQVMKLLKGEM